MAISGRKPKPAGQSRHRNRAVHSWIEVDNVPFEDGPKLPGRRCNIRGWSARARAKWAAWSSMPHCVLWGPSDWSFALDTLELAVLVHEGHTRYATEVRNREKVLGTTAGARRDQRIRYVDPSPDLQVVDTAGDIADYRDL